MKVLACKEGLLSQCFLADNPAIGMLKLPPVQAGSTLMHASPAMFSTVLSVRSLSVCDISKDAHI